MLTVLRWDSCKVRSPQVDTRTVTTPGGSGNNVCAHLMFLARSTRRRLPFQSLPSRCLIACMAINLSLSAQYCVHGNKQSTTSKLYPINIIIMLHDQEPKTSGLSTARIPDNARILDWSILFKFSLQVLQHVAVGLQITLIVGMLQMTPYRHTPFH